MQGKTTGIDIIKQFFENLSEQDKKTFIDNIIKKQEKVEKIITQHKAKCCPHCNSTSFKKNGIKNKAQRYLCKDCNKTFTDTNNTILFSGKKDIEVWKKYIHCLLEKHSLRKTAQICNISLPTAFSWRHKILDTLQTMMNEVELNGIVEADETFFPLSFKGNHKNFSLPRLAKKRGGSASRRGLSREQVCIPCIVNHNGLSVARISNLGKPRLTDLQKVINSNIAKESIFVTDSFRAYLKVLLDLNLNHIRIPRNRHKLGAFNIQTINSYHSRLKAMITYNFRGVSTKHLNNYLVYHNFVNFAKEPQKEKEVILLDFIQKTYCKSLVKNISNRPVIAV